MALVDASHGRHDLARCAVAALEAVVVDEGLLHRMQDAVRASQALDGGDRLALHRHRQGQAGQHSASIDVHGAGPALALVATLLGAGQAEMLAQGVEQGGARIERQAMVASVDDQHDFARTVWSGVSGSLR